LTRLERSIAVILRAGVIASTVCLAVGLVLSLNAATVRPSDVLLKIGILVLLCTPVARVAISTAEYVAERDWRFATLTGIVLLELLASAVAALVFHRSL
jgi:uncharacterized membrane protein